MATMHRDASGRSENAASFVSHLGEHYHRVDGIVTDGDLLCGRRGDHGPQHGPSLQVPSSVPLCLRACQCAHDLTALRPIPRAIPAPIHGPSAGDYSTAAHWHRNCFLHPCHGDRWFRRGNATLNPKTRPNPENRSNPKIKNLQRNWCVDAHFEDFSTALFVSV